MTLTLDLRDVGLEECNPGVRGQVADKLAKAVSDKLTCHHFDGHTLPITSAPYGSKTKAKFTLAQAIQGDILRKLEPKKES
ncbi:hypothetical protein H0H92_001868, partial [Tricholoma furcatifolium]